jgi:RNA polymerase sigma-70 factor (ECF subfamily)
MDNAQLVNAALAGSVGAMKRLLVEHRPELLAYVERHLPAELRATHDAEDIVQDVWIKAYRQIGGLRPEGERAYFRWLATIARNHLIDLARRRHKSRQGPIAGRAIAAGAAVDNDPSAEDESVVALLAELAVYRRTPSRSAMWHEVLTSLDAAFARLDPDYQTALRLRYFDGKSVAEAATAMGRSQGAVAMLCSRATRALRDQIHSLPAFG